MKKLIFVLGVIALTATPALAQDMWVGGTLGYDYASSTVETDVTSDDTVIKSWNITGLVDLSFLRIGVGYTKNFSEAKTTGDFPSTSEGLDVSYLNLSALLKYPIEMSEGRVKFWPALGLGYDINLTNEDDTGESDADALNDLFILGGVGIDYSVDEQTAVTFSALYGYNLTPDPDSDIPSGVDISSSKINISIGAIFKL